MREGLYEIGSVSEPVADFLLKLPEIFGQVVESSRIGIQAWKVEELHTWAPLLGCVGIPPPLEPKNIPLPPLGPVL